jgi:hypothetical protein
LSLQAADVRRFSHTWKSHRRDRTGWLGRQDSNLGMAEIKIPQFGLFRTPGGRRSMTRCGQRRRKGGRHQSGSGIEARRHYSRFG